MNTDAISPHSIAKNTVFVNSQRSFPEAIRQAVIRNPMIKETITQMPKILIIVLSFIEVSAKFSWDYRIPRLRPPQGFPVGAWALLRPFWYEAFLDPATPFLRR